MRQGLPDSWRYHFREISDLHAVVARSEGLEAEQVLVGAGSSEVLHTAVEAFTSSSRPLVTMSPTFEVPESFARALGRPTIRVPLADDFGANVRRMAEVAATSSAGLVYLCNPNNPTAAITKKADVDWLAANLPANTTLLIDEAYIHFSESQEAASALAHVRQGKDVVVTRTFSKIYGMAGLRVGFGCARADLIRRMEPFRDNVISIVSARAARAALEEAATLVPQRRAKMTRIRGDLCAWLTGNGYSYIQPHTNFVMIDVRRDAREVMTAMIGKGVAPGRPFPPLTNMLRVTIGTEAEMDKFKRVFLETVNA
jgi:histidinol-phosphate/aromatic aminotransferase/cobyric acid decarboxylase-like protein